MSGTPKYTAGPRDIGERSGTLCHMTTVIYWTEKGEALGLGKKGAFDSQAVFTPNIIKAKGKFYLFYTGVKPTPGRTDGVFENNSTNDITAIGLAVADSPDGPFKRIGDGGPVLEISDKDERFDSYRIDDASLLYRDGKYWLYYKGRSIVHGEKGPRYTRMGVAFADKPEGTYMKYGDPILAGSHEVLIWPHRRGVAALASFSSTLEYAPDGIDFTSVKLNVKVKRQAARPRSVSPRSYRSGEIRRGFVNGEFRWLLTEANATLYAMNAI